jgi:sugar lactone lactonase YvrE
MKAELILDARAELAEGPAWDAARQRVLWVNIPAGEVHFYHLLERADTCITVGESAGCAAPAQGGRTIAALQNRLVMINREGDAVTSLAGIPDPPPGIRFNDGKCDPAGRFLAGTMDDAEREANGSLYSWQPGGKMETLRTGLRISNGLAWSPDGGTFYHIDTPTRQVMAFDYDLSCGAIANPRVVITVPPELGWPDGMTSDRQGMLWIAMWGGGRLTCWNPHSGQLMTSVHLPALNVTACAFGGRSMTELFVTTARKGLSADELSRFPLSGGLFRIKTNVEGMPTFVFAG